MVYPSAYGFLWYHQTFLWLIKIATSVINSVVMSVPCQETDRMYWPVRGMHYVFVSTIYFSLELFRHWCIFCFHCMYLLQHIFMLSTPTIISTPSIVLFLLTCILVKFGKKKRDIFILIFLIMNLWQYLDYFHFHKNWSESIGIVFKCSKTLLQSIVITTRTNWSNGWFRAVIKKKKKRSIVNKFG